MLWAAQHSPWKHGFVPTRMMAGVHSGVMIEGAKSRSRVEGKQKPPAGDYIVGYGDIEGDMLSS